MDPIKISEKLISFKSITPKSNGSLEYIKKIFVKNNFSCELLKFGNPPVINLFANYKGGAGPRICFAGHTDVVPPGDLANWKFNPFKPKVINGNLYGRGASDMKSAIGAFLSATIVQSKVEEGNFGNGTYLTFSFNSLSSKLDVSIKTIERCPLILKLFKTVG